MDQFYGTFLTFCGAFSIEFKFLGELKPVHHIIPPLHQRDPSQLLITSHQIIIWHHHHVLEKIQFQYDKHSVMELAKREVKNGKQPTMFRWPFSNLFFNYSHEQKPNRAKDYEGEKMRNNSTFHAVERQLQQSHKQEKLIKSSVTRGKRHSRALLFPLVT